VDAQLKPQGISMLRILTLIALTALTAAQAATPRAASAPASATQSLRQLVQVEGVRENQLLGYGLVVGLNGSGDSTQVKYAGQSVANLLKQFGVKLPEGVDAKARNVATVMVSASFPSGYRRGQTIDVTVSSMGDAKSLRGGVLLLSELHAVDGEVYALAQGNLVVGGVTAQGQSGSSVTVNTPTAGRIPNGATIEREIASDFDTRPEITLNLRRPSFETATRIVEAVTQRFGDIATTRDATTVQVKAPADPTRRVAFMAQLDALQVEAAPALPRVIFNSRTGTVVIAEGVRVRPAAVSHGALKVVIGESPQVSQPQPFSQGKTQVVPRSQVQVEQGSGRMFRWTAGASLQSIIDTINSIGASPDDIMAILQALDQAGAIDGELEVI
jgi:flagellar P-ring protein precursor FlgI